MVKSLILTIALIQKILVLIEHCICIHCFVWEEIGDVLQGLVKDRWWTSKPDVCLGGDRGWTPLASLLCVLIYIEVFYWYNTKMCINLEVWSVWFELESHLFVDIGRMWILYMWFTVVSIARFWDMMIKLESKTYLRQLSHETVKWSNWLSWLTICWMLLLYS